MSGIDSTTPKPHPTRRSIAREYLESIVVAVILALFIRTFAVQAFKIPTGSMENNLLIGDYLLVNKLVYSPSFGALEAKLFGKKRIERGHVVVFKYPERPERDFIKRVIGLPGEKVEIRGRKVYIDDVLIDEPYVQFLDPPQDPREAATSQRDYYGPKVVPPGELFVMGDNRDRSADSRFWGYLPVDQVKGRALLVYWSYDASREEFQRTGVVNWIRDTASAAFRARWGRLFMLIR
jgi:signal peptidase I